MVDTPREDEGEGIQNEEPRPDNDAAIAWLKTWHPEGPWVLVEIDPNEAPRRPPAQILHDEGEVLDYLEEKNGKRNLYFVPNRVGPDYFEQKIDGRGRPISWTTPTKGEIEFIVCLQVDLDLPKTGPRSAQTPENIEWLFQRVKALYPSPTAIVFSGGGIQAYWLFDTPLAAQAFQDRVEAAGKAIASELGSDAVQNINRLMRLPGTVNLGNAKKREAGRKPALARLMHADWGRTWSLATDEIPTILPDYGQDGGDPSVPPWEEGDIDYTEDQSEPQPHPSGQFVTDRFHELPRNWQREVLTGDASRLGGDRSRLVASFIRHCLMKRWTDEDVIAILINKQFKISDHIYSQGGNPASVARRQVQRLREKSDATWDYGQDGRPQAGSPRNIMKALDLLQVNVSSNEFTHKTIIKWRGTVETLNDDFTANFKYETHDRFGFNPKGDVLSDVLRVAGTQNRFHPPRSYLASVQPHWDGEPRLETWLIDLAGAPDREIIRVWSRLMLIAAVRRIRKPGCKFDQMMLLISPQGKGKSSAIQMLCPDIAWFNDSFPLDAPDPKKVIESTEGKWIIECSELTGIRRGHETEVTKSNLSRQVDIARLAYDRYPSTRYRQFVLFGTTNSTAVLPDHANRRYWPIFIQEFDLVRLAALRDQLWAEAATLEAQGVSIELDRKYWPLAQAEQDRITIGDHYVDILGSHLAPYQRGKLSALDVRKLLGLVKAGGPNENARITEAMAQCGWERTTARILGTITRAFVKGPEPRPELYVFYDPTDGTVSINDAAIELPGDRDVPF